MKKLLFLALASSLAASTVQSPTISGVVDTLRYKAYISENYSELFAQYPEAAAYFRGKRDGLNQAADIIESHSIE